MTRMHLRWRYFGDREYTLFGTEWDKEKAVRVAAELRARGDQARIVPSASGRWYIYFRQNPLPADQEPPR